MDTFPKQSGSQTFTGHRAFGTLSWIPGITYIYTHLTHIYICRIYTYTHTCGYFNFDKSALEVTFHLIHIDKWDRCYEFKDDFIEETVKRKILYIFANYKISLAYFIRRTF